MMSNGKRYSKFCGSLHVSLGAHISDHFHFCIHQQICIECLHALGRHVLGRRERASNETHKIAAPTGSPLDGEMDIFAHVNTNSATLQTWMDAEQGVVKGETGAR